MTILGIDPTDDGALPEAPAAVSTVEIPTDDDRRNWAVRKRDETRAVLAPWRQKLLDFLLAEDDAGQLAEIELTFYEASDTETWYPERNHFTFRMPAPDPKMPWRLGPKISITLAREEV